MNPEIQQAAGAGGLIVDEFGNPIVPTGEQYTTSIAQQEPVPPVQADSAGWNLSNIFGLLNIVAGLMLVASFILFFGGLSGWLSRLGLEGRQQGLTYMYRGISVLFVLILLLALINYVQYHTATVLTIIGVAIVAFGAWAVISTWGAGGGEEDEH